MTDERTAAITEATDAKTAATAATTAAIAAERLDPASTGRPGTRAAVDPRLAHGPFPCPGRRRFATLGFVVSVLLGLASRKLGPTGFALWDSSFGNADYAVMLGFGLLALRPTVPARAVGLGAVGICFTSSSFS